MAGQGQVDRIRVNTLNPEAEMGGGHRGAERAARRTGHNGNNWSGGGNSYDGLGRHPTEGGDRWHDSATTLVGCIAEIMNSELGR